MLTLWKLDSLLKIVPLKRQDRQAVLSLSDQQSKIFFALNASERKIIVSLGASMLSSALELLDEQAGDLWFYPYSRVSHWVKEFKIPRPSGSGGDIAAIGAIVKEMSRKYLRLDDVRVPALIPQPTLPLRLELRQDEFELDDEFEERVQTETQKRQRRIESLQISYRQQVEQRNAYLQLLELVSTKRRANLPNVQKTFTKDAMLLVWGGFELGDPELDKSNGDVYLSIRSKRGSYSERLAFGTRGARNLRKAFFREPKNVAWGIGFALDAAGALSLESGIAKYRGEESNGRLADPNKAIRNKALVAVIDSADRSSFADLRGLQKQNPNLKDNFEIGSIVYKDGREATARYQDDIPALLKSFAAYPTEKTRWLLAIGAEKYQNTDDIRYAKRSAELFVEAPARRFGIRKGNIIALYDDKATSGNIKHQTKRLLENIKPGDSIYFYYNGHGIPLPAKDNAPYLLPTDMIPDYVGDDTFFELRNFYRTLTDSAAGKVIAFVDSCFTGKTDNRSVFKGSKAATRLAPKKVSFDQSKMALITAGTDKQFSSAYEERGHRLFTYFVIKSLLNKQRTSVRDLYREVSVAVSDTSAGKGLNAKQDPVFSGNEQLEL